MWKKTLMYISQFRELPLLFGAPVNVASSFFIGVGTQETLNGLL